MRILALDLSKTATGWACWAPGDERVASGVWQLGSEYTSRGRVYAKLHENMIGLHRLGKIEALFFEDAINIMPGAVQTNVESVRLAAGLCAHAESFGEAVNCRHICGVNQVTWRREFLGRIARGTKKVDLKDMAMQRARELGFKPQRHDEAEAIGILDYACTELDLAPFWRLQAPLVTQFGGGQ